MQINRPSSKNLALMLLAMTQFVLVIDASIVNVAMPSIGRALHFSQADLSWVVNAYTLTFGGFLLLGGRLADLVGRRRMFMSGLVLFSVSSLMGGVAQSETWLIAARAAQGLGGAIVSPAALSIITTMFAEGAERNRALGVWGAVAGAGGAAGVLLGGVLTSGLSWRWVLFVNVPIGLVCAVIAPRLIGESRTESSGRAFDLPGAVTATGGLALLVYALVDAVNAGWGSTATLGRLGGAVALLVAFLLIEARHRAPLMPFSIFRLRTLRGADAVALLVGMSLFSMFFFISLYMQQVLHYSALRTGVSYLPLAIGIIIAAGVASAAVTRVGFKPVLLCGLLLITGALVWFSRVPPSGGSFAGRRPWSIAAGCLRTRSLVRFGDDRGDDGDAPAGGGSGLGPRQHRAAGRRRARPCAARHDRQHPHPRDLERRPPRHDVRVDEGIRARLRGWGRVCPDGCAAGARADLLTREPLAFTGGPYRRQRGAGRDVSGGGFAGAATRGPRCRAERSGARSVSPANWRGAPLGRRRILGRVRRDADRYSFDFSGCDDGVVCAVVCGVVVVFVVGVWGDDSV